jgi:disulfide bond formation protein DsbB
MIPLYLILAVGGLVGTWYFNIVSITANENYLAGWFGSAASSSAAIDILVVAIAASVFFVAEGRRVGMKRTWVLIPLSMLTALAFTFPLFLAWREVALRRRAVAPARQR